MLRCVLGQYNYACHPDRIGCAVECEVGSHNGPPFMVSELLAGEPLPPRLQTGRIAEGINLTDLFLIQGLRDENFAIASWNPYFVVARQSPVRGPDSPAPLCVA